MESIERELTESLVELADCLRTRKSDGSGSTLLAKQSISNLFIVETQVQGLFIELKKKKSDETGLVKAR